MCVFPALLGHLISKKRLISVGHFKKFVKKPKRDKT